MTVFVIILMVGQCSQLSRFSDQKESRDSLQPQNAVVHINHI